MLDIVDRFPLYPLIVTFVLYPLAAWIVLKLTPETIKIQCFALLNVAGLAALCWLSGGAGVRFKEALSYSRVSFLFFLIYVAIVALNYALLRQCRLDGTHWP